MSDKTRFQISPEILKEFENKSKIKLEPNPIGSGGFSTVYTGIKDNRKFVIKIIPYDGTKEIKDVNDKENRRNNIKNWASNEALVTSNLRNKNCIRSYGNHELLDKARAIILELAINKDLNYLISVFYSNKLFNTNMVKELLCNNDDNKKNHHWFFNLSETFIRFFVVQIINSFDYLYKMSFVHCDIKPDNFLLSRNFQIKLTDFALSNSVNFNNVFHLSSAGTIVYMPPENFEIKQVPGKDAFKIDYYALGVMLYKFYSGKQLINPNQDKKITSEQLREAIKKAKSDFKEYNPSENFLKLFYCLIDPEFKSRANIEDIKKNIWLYENENLIRNCHENHDGDYLKFLLELNKIDYIKAYKEIESKLVKIHNNYTYKIFDIGSECKRAKKDNIRKYKGFKNFF